MARITSPVVWHTRTAATAASALAGGVGAALVTFALSSTNLSWQVLVLLVIAPCVEEAIFRAGLQEWLIRTGQRLVYSLAIPAVTFAAAHVIAWQQWGAAWLIVPGLVLGVVYQATRKVRWCVAVHSVMNAVWLLAVTN